MADFAPVELRPGLLRWTARHPAAVDDPEPEGVDDWPSDVGSVACLAPDSLVLVDPLLPGAGEAPLWAELDSLAARRDGRVAVLTTVRFHGRSHDAAVERFGATGEPPAGIHPFATATETLFWIEEHRALVPGDILIGDGAGGLRLCPESWLGYHDGVTLDSLRPRLRELLELPIELVLVSHGEPVTSGGRVALERALSR